MLPRLPDPSNPNASPGALARNYHEQSLAGEFGRSLWNFPGVRQFLRHTGLPSFVGNGSPADFGDKPGSAACISGWCEHLARIAMIDAAVELRCQAEP